MKKLTEIFVVNENNNTQKYYVYTIQFDQNDETGEVTITGRVLNNSVGIEIPKEYLNKEKEIIRILIDAGYIQEHDNVSVDIGTNGIIYVEDRNNNVPIYQLDKKLVHTH